MATAQPVSQDVKNLPQPLDMPNGRSALEKAKIAVFGASFRGLVDLASLPVILARDDDLFKITIDTGATGTCRLCIFVPRTVDPESSKRTRGVVMHLHGGGWSISRPETEAPLCRYLADNVGCVVVAPDYRKAPIYPYPHALEQCYNVLSWIANGGLAQALHDSPHPSIRIDPRRLAVSGGSSGSNLACALTVLCISRPLPSHTLISAQGLLYPALNLAVPYDDKIARVDPARILPQWMSRFFLKAYLPPPRSAEDPLVSPALAPEETIAQFPPTVILTAAYDYLAYEAEEFAERLRAAGVEVHNHRFEDVGHGFDGIPTRNKKQRMLNNKARDEAWGMIAELFTKVLVEKEDVRPDPTRTPDETQLHVDGKMQPLVLN